MRAENTNRKLIFINVKDKIFFYLLVDELFLSFYFILAPTILNITVSHYLHRCHPLLQNVITNLKISNEILVGRVYCVHLAVVCYKRSRQTEQSSESSVLGVEIVDCLHRSYSPISVVYVQSFNRTVNFSLEQTSIRAFIVGESSDKLPT